VLAGISNDPHFLQGSDKSLACQSIKTLFVLMKENNSLVHSKQVTLDKFGEAIEIPFIGFKLKESLLTDHGFDKNEIALLARFKDGN
jgi:hypothetical protein